MRSKSSPTPGAGGKLAPGSAHVRWRQHDSALDAGVRTEFTSELQLADRVFLLGDILTRASNQLGQTGIVVGMRMFCELHASDGSPLGRAPTTLLAARGVPSGHTRAAPARAVAWARRRGLRQCADQLR